jgi:hypothetical protein
MLIKALALLIVKLKMTLSKGGHHVQTYFKNDMVFGLNLTSKLARLNSDRPDFDSKI